VVRTEKVRTRDHEGTTQVDHRGGGRGAENGGQLQVWRTERPRVWGLLAAASSRGRHARLKQQFNIFATAHHASRLRGGGEMTPPPPGAIMPASASLELGLVTLGTAVVALVWLKAMEILRDHDVVSAASCRKWIHIGTGPLYMSAYT